MDPNLRPQVSRPAATSILTQGPPPPLSNLHQYQMQPHYPLTQPHTLPPLQHPQTQSPVPHAYLSQPYRQDMSRYPPTTANDVYAASSAPMAPHTSVNSLPSASFLTHHHAQSQLQPLSMLPPASTAQAYPQPIAPAPPRERRVDYGSMSSGAFSNAENRGAIWANAEGSSAAFVSKEPSRSQVVGTQGRRGILPSVPGRAVALPNGVNGTAKTTTIPVKDADGKFPCPHCNKTYLHAKHLKRHLLRHTGDRPYMCVLCKDTFSRSDILKRHFQKCSLRRGNPTGVSHLSHPHAHLKRAQAAGAAKPVQGDVSSSIPTSNGIVAPTFGDGPVNGVAMASSHQPRFAEQQHLGYPMPPVNGLNRGHTDGGFTQGPSHQRPLWLAEPKQSPYLVQSGTDTAGQLNVDLPPIEPAKAPIAPDGKRPAVPAGASSGHPGDIDWVSMFQPHSHDSYINPVFPSSIPPVHDPIHTQVDSERKFYPATSSGHQEGGLNGLYLASTSLGGDGTLGSHPISNFRKVAE